MEHSKEDVICAINEFNSHIMAARQNLINAHAAIKEISTLSGSAAGIRLAVVQLDGVIETAEDFLKEMAKLT